jgi:PIN domain nuclease of toxin-antitoxin system
MRLLLDTHIVLWWMAEPTKLSSKVHQAITNSDNAAFISAASIWELAIKHKLGRVDLPHYFLEALQAAQIQILSIEAHHALATIDLPPIHQDPFDRMLIAQAKCENLVLVTKDANILKYPISTLH